MLMMIVIMISIYRPRARLAPAYFPWTTRKRCTCRAGLYNTLPSTSDWNLSVMGCCLPYFGPRNPSESVRIRPNPTLDRIFRIQNPYLQVQIPIQDYKIPQRNPLWGCSESARIRPSTESVRIRKRHPRLHDI